MDESSTPHAGRRGLGRGMTIFLVVDVLLLLAVAVALTLFFSGGDTGLTGSAPSSGATQPGATSSATPGGEPAGGDGPETFALPSGNIACAITDDAATCTIADSTAEPATQDGCAGVVGPMLTVTAEGASTPCLQGALPGPAAPGTPVLDYGRSTTVADFTCASATSGVTCRHDPSGAGFTLARAGHRIL